MRFLAGLLLGFCVGFAATILFAPQKGRPTEVVWPEGREEEKVGADGNPSLVGRFRRAARSLQERLNEAWAEAKQASAEAEEEMRARYEKMAGRKAESRK